MELDVVKTGSLIVIVLKKSQKSLLRLLSTTGKKSKAQKGIRTKQNSQSSSDSELMISSLRKAS